MLRTDSEVLAPPPVWTESFKVHSFEADFRGRSTVESVCRRFQEAAWSHAEHLGLGYERLHEQNKLWVLSRLSLRFERSLRWPESVTLQTWPRASRTAFAFRDFEIFDANGVRVISGTSAWLVLDAVSRRVQRLDKLLSSIGPLSNKKALEQDPERLGGLPSQKLLRQVNVLYSDIDVNGHVNHARYLGWIMDSYSVDFHRNHRVRLLEINYLGEARGGEDACVFSHSTDEEEQQHSIVKTENKFEVCRAKLIWTRDGTK